MRIPVAIALAVFLLSGCASETKADQQADMLWVLGSTATLTARADRVPCPGTEKAFQQVWDAQSINDEQGAEGAMDSSGGILLVPGERIKVLSYGSGFGSGHVEIRIIGPSSDFNVGKACWTDEKSLATMTKDVRQS